MTALTGLKVLDFTQMMTGPMARSGEGQRVDLSMLDASLFSHVPCDVYYSVTGKTPERWGNEHWDIVPNNVYQSADGQGIMIISINDKFWKILCGALGDPEFASDPLYATKSARLANRGELDARLAALFATRPLAEWDQILASAGAIYSPVRSWPEVFGDPYVQEHMLRRLTHVNGTGFDVINNPLRLSETPMAVRTAPPTLGQHTAEILAVPGWPKNPNG